MKPACNVATLIERFFTERLMRQRNVSANTIASYKDTFRLLFMFAQERLRRSPSALTLTDLDATFIGAFLTDLETNRGASAKTRNLRLTAIRSFFRFVSFEEPAHSSLIQRVLAIPSKRHDKRQVHFLTRPEIEAVLAAPDRTTWLGRRDHTLLLLAAQTGLRLSELTGLDRDAVHIGSGAHVRCVGKGRKERTTPLTTLARRALQAWLKEPVRKGATGRLRENLADDTWAAGTGLEVFPTAGWADGRARFVLNILQRAAADPVVEDAEIEEQISALAG